MNRSFIVSKQITTYKYTPKDYLKAFIAFAVLGTLIFIALKLAFIPKEVATDTQVCDVLKSRGYEPLDRTEQYIEANPELGIVKTILYAEENFQFFFFIFEEQEGAARVYRYYITNMSEIARKNRNNCSETGGYRANFVRHTLKTDEEYYNLMRIGNTLAYGYCDAEKSSEMYAIMSDIGYTN